MSKGNGDHKNNQESVNANWDDIEFVRLYILHDGRVTEDIESLDPDMIETIHNNVKFPIFLEKENVYNLEELIETYPFLRVLGKDPREIFTKQQITYYEARNIKNEIVPDLCEHLVHDEGKEAVSVKDQMYNIKNKTNVKRIPTKIIDTNIFIGREKWKHFLFLNQLKSSIHAFRDVKLLANSNIGSALLLEAPDTSSLDSATGNRATLLRPRDEPVRSEQFTDEVGLFVHGSDGIANEPDTNETRVELKSAPNSEMKNTNSTEQKLNHENGIHNKETIITSYKMAAQNPDASKIDSLTFIIQPMKKEYYDLYPQVDKINESKLGDAGVDVPLCTEMNMPSYLTTDGIGTLVDLGIRMCLIDEKGNYHSSFLMPRSSINKTPLQLSNSIGLIDPGYRGNIMAGLRNFSGKEYKRDRGTALFQLVPRSEIPFKYVIVNEQSPLYSLLNADTKRSTGGFGSTGTKGNTSQ